MPSALEQVNRLVVRFGVEKDECQFGGSVRFVRNGIRVGSDSVDVFVVSP